MGKRTDALAEQNIQLARALEATQSELALQERRLDEVYYLNLNAVPGRDEYQVLPQAKRKEIVRKIRILRQENPLAKQAIKLAIRFTFGKGITFLVKDEQSREAVQEFWDHPTNQSVLCAWSSMKERFDELLTDGEVFTLMAVGPAAPYVELSTIPMEEIDDIIYHPQNRFVPVYYKRVWKPFKYDARANNGQGGWIESDPNKPPRVRYYRDYRMTDEALAEIEDINIPDGLIEADHFIRHRMVNPVWMLNGRRGVSELFASREWFRVFRNFMEDRGSINAAANAFSYVRKVKGGPAAVASITGKIGGVPMGPTAGEEGSLRRLSRPIAGAIYDINEGMDITGLRADTGAVDAKEDARLILMTGGAGVATNLPYFGEGGDANLATAQAMELPMVKSYEDYQKEVETDLDEILKFVIKTARGHDVEKEALHTAFDMPPIVTQDVVKFTSGWAQVVSQIAPGNKVVKLAAIRGALSTMDVPNIEGIMDDIEAEEERLATEKEEMRQKMLETGIDPNAPPVPGQPGKPGDPSKPPLPVGKGAVKNPNPDDQRLTKGKPPRIPATGGRLANSRS